MPRQLADLLTDEQMARLRPLAISELIDLVSALEADHGSIGRLLDLGPSQVERLHRRALERLSPDLRRLVEDARVQPPSLGAWEPARG